MITDRIRALPSGRCRSLEAGESIGSASNEAATLQQKKFCGAGLSSCLIIHHTPKTEQQFCAVSSCVV